MFVQSNIGHNVNYHFSQSAPLNSSPLPVLFLFPYVYQVIQILGDKFPYKLVSKKIDRECLQRHPRTIQFLINLLT